MKKIVTLSLVLAVFLVLGGYSNALAFDHEFIGAKKCSMCHKTPKQGEQFPLWEASAHAKAFETLGTPEAKEAGAKLGVDNPQTSGKCLKCHSTAYGFSESVVSAAIPVEEGVSCESCHGPGKDYMKMSVMKDRALAIAAGLEIGDESTCVKCHNAESPTFKGFDYASHWDKIKHPVPE